MITLKICKNSNRNGSCYVGCDLFANGECKLGLGIGGRPTHHCPGHGEYLLMTKEELIEQIKTVIAEEIKDAATTT
jgi:hypothetical protein